MFFTVIMVLYITLISQIFVYLKNKDVLRQRLGK